MFDLKALFGNKPWYQSVTGWGLVLWLGFSAALAQACGADGVLSVETCGAITAWTTPIGQGLTVLGIRKAVVT